MSTRQMFTKRRWFVILAATMLFLTVSLSLGPAVALASNGEASEVLVGQLGGTTGSAYVEGNYAYIGEGPRLVILDITDRSNPREVGRTDVLPGVVGGVHIVGDYAYFNSSGLRIFSVEDRSNPTEVNHLEGIAIHDMEGDFAYGTIFGGRRLIILDITNPAEPTEVYRSRGFPGYVRERDLHVVGNYAYVSMGDELRIISIADRSAPSEVGSLDLGVDPRVRITSVYADETHAYITDRNHLRVISVADKRNPEEVGSYACRRAEDVQVVGNYAYLADRWGGLRIISIADKTDPTQVGVCDIPSEGGAREVQVIGDYAYVSAMEKGLRIISVEDNHRPTEVGFFDTASYMSGLQVIGDYAYMTSWEGLRIISVADRTNPTEVGSFEDIDDLATFGFHVVGDYAYVSDKWVGLHIISVADRRNPEQVGFFRKPMDVSCLGDVYVQSDYAFLTTGMSGEDGPALLIVSVEDPTHPELIGSFHTSLGDHLGGIQVAGDYLYAVGKSYHDDVSEHTNNIFIISVADKEHPREVGSLSLSSYPPPLGGIHVVEDYAYLVSMSVYSDLKIISVADRSDPVQIGSLDIEPGAQGQDVQVVGDIAYVANGIAIQFISIADKESPISEDFFETPGYPVGVVHEGDYTYVADESGGLIILSPTSLPWRMLYRLQLYIYQPVLGRFSLKNPFPEDTFIDLVFKTPKEFLKRGRVTFHLPKELFKRWQGEGKAVGMKHIEGTRFQIFAPRAALRNIPMDAFEKQKVSLEFTALPGGKEVSYNVYVSEEIKGEALGGSVFELSIPGPEAPSGPLSVSASASATQVCGSKYSHKLKVGWKVNGGKPPMDVTMEITRPDGSVQSVGVSELEGERTFRLNYPGGGTVGVKIEARDAGESSASASATASLSPCG